MGSSLYEKSSYYERDPYLQELFKDYPVLWVDDFSEVTQTMLMDNYHLYEKAQNIILGELSLPYYFQTTLHKVYMDKKLVVSNHNSDLEWLSMTYDYGFFSREYYNL